MVQDFPGVAFCQARVSRGLKKTITNQNGSNHFQKPAVLEGGKKDRGEPG